VESTSTQIRTFNQLTKTQISNFYFCLERKRVAMIRAIKESSRFLVFTLLLVKNHATQLVSSCNSRLPMSLSSIINDLEAEGATSITRACLVTSTGVTSSQRSSILRAIFGLEETELTAFGTKVDGSDNGLAVANPNSKASAEDVAATVIACGGTVIFSPSSIDLSRGEGLFDTLAPAIERLLASGITSNLIVVASNKDEAKEKLQRAAASFLPNLIQPRGGRPAQILEDVFSSVEYVSTAEEVASKLANAPACEPSQAASAIAAEAYLSSSPAKITALTGKDLAAARKLGPKARVALEFAVETVKAAVAGTPLITEFGELCEAVVKRAILEVETSTFNSPLAQQIKSQLREELYSEFSEIYEGQITQLQTSSFEAFRKNLSQLRVSPNLASDMDRVSQESFVAFGKAVQKLVARGSRTWCTIPAKTAFQQKLRDFCSERLLVAKASGQYKPVPRKGVTVGLHWLLPKPFGNDFRQEPWMVHAVDNMVYVPKDKITEVSPEEVKKGDWRNKIVPAPNAREMIFVQ
jgi:hypothetical protein